MVSWQHHRAISFLRENLNENEEFLTMTSEASWYYFVNKACPIRFQVIYHAMPYFYQNEIVSDLENSNVKFIIYRNDHWANTVDGFDNEVRLPIVTEYVAPTPGIILFLFKGSSLRSVSCFVTGL